MCLWVFLFGCYSSSGVNNSKPLLNVIAAFHHLFMCLAQFDISNSPIFHTNAIPRSAPHRLLLSALPVPLPVSALNGHSQCSQINGFNNLEKIQLQPVVSQFFGRFCPYYQLLLSFGWKKPFCRIARAR